MAKESLKKRCEEQWDPFVAKWTAFICHYSYCIAPRKMEEASHLTSGMWNRQNGVYVVSCEHEKRLGRLGLGFKQLLDLQFFLPTAVVNGDCSNACSCHVPGSIVPVRHSWECFEPPESLADVEKILQDLDHDSLCLVNDSNAIWILVLLIFSASLILNVELWHKALTNGWQAGTVLYWEHEIC